MSSCNHPAGPPPSAAANDGAVVADAAVDYETLLFSRDEAVSAANFSNLNNPNYSMIQEYIPPSWCASLPLDVSIRRLSSLCLYALRKEAEAVTAENAKRRITGGENESRGDNSTIQYYRGQAILARAARRWLKDLI